MRKKQTQIPPSTKNVYYVGSKPFIYLNQTKFKYIVRKQIKIFLQETWVYFGIQHGKKERKLEKKDNKFLGLLQKKENTTFWSTCYFQ